MEIYDTGIQDDKSNVTRFLALAREPLPPRPDVAYKTSIAFTMKETSPARFSKPWRVSPCATSTSRRSNRRPMRTNPVTQSAEREKQCSFRTSSTSTSAAIHGGRKRAKRVAAATGKRHVPYAS